MQYERTFIARNIVDQEIFRSIAMCIAQSPMSAAIKQEAGKVLILEDLLDSDRRDIVTRVWKYLSYPLQGPFFFIPVFADQIRDYSPTRVVQFFKEIGISCIAEGRQCICYLSNSHGSSAQGWKDRICAELIKDPTFAWHIAAVAWLHIAMSKQAFFAAVPFEWLDNRSAQISGSNYLHYLHLKETQAQILAKQLAKEKKKQEKKKRKQEEKERKSSKEQVKGEGVAKKKSRSGLKA